MDKWIKAHIKSEPTNETLVAIVTVLLMWLGYYINSRGFFEGNAIWEIGIWGIGVMIIMNVWLPAWWIVKKKREGFSGMGITTKKLGSALVLSILLGAWRFIELMPYIKEAGLVPVLLFNLLSIWEVCFIYCWLFTRFDKAFGKIGAVILTALCVGLYHVGSLPVVNIIYLVICTGICGICFGITENIFTLWPIYWVIGCSASVLKGYGAQMFPWEIVLLMGFVLFLQVIFLVILKCSMYFKSKGYKQSKQEIKG